MEKAVKLDICNDTIDKKNDKPNAVEVWKKAQADLKSVIQKQEQTLPPSASSRIKSLRQGTVGIESQVSIMNRRVIRMAVGGPESTDV